MEDPRSRSKAATQKRSSYERLRPARPRWPPPPSVEDDHPAAVQEHHDAPLKGSQDQFPVIQDAEEDLFADSDGACGHSASFGTRQNLSAKSSKDSLRPHSAQSFSDDSERRFVLLRKHEDPLESENDDLDGLAGLRKFATAEPIPERVRAPYGGVSDSETTAIPERQRSQYAGTPGLSRETTRSVVESPQVLSFDDRSKYMSPPLENLDYDARRRRDHPRAYSTSQMKAPPGVQELRLDSKNVNSNNSARFTGGLRPPSLADFGRPGNVQTASPSASPRSSGEFFPAYMADNKNTRKAAQTQAQFVPNPQSSTRNPLGYVDPNRPMPSLSAKRSSQNLGVPPPLGAKDTNYATAQPIPGMPKGQTFSGLPSERPRESPLSATRPRNLSPIDLQSPYRDGGRSTQPQYAGDGQVPRSSIPSKTSNFGPNLNASTGTIPIRPQPRSRQTSPLPMQPQLDSQLPNIQQQRNGDRPRTPTHPGNRNSMYGAPPPSNQDYVPTRPASIHGPSKPKTTSRSNSLANQIPELPPCSWSKFKQGEHEWCTIPHHENMDICVSCREGLRNAGYQGEFIRQPPRSSTLGTRCDLSNGWMRLAWLIVIREPQVGNSVLGELLRITNQYPDCPGKDGFNPDDTKIDNRRWYGTVDPKPHKHRHGHAREYTNSGEPLVPEYAICTSCVHCMETVFPILKGKLLHRIPGTDKLPRYSTARSQDGKLRAHYDCSLHPSHRDAQYLTDLLCELAREGYSKKPARPDVNLWQKTIRALYKRDKKKSSQRDSDDIGDTD